MRLPKAASAFRDSLLQWATENVREYPWREQERSRYEVFVAEFFLTQTPADNVADVYPEFVDRYPSLEAIEEADEEDLVSVIDPLGFQRMRARALKSIARSVDDLPDTTGQLRELERVGPYVANATLCFADRSKLPILDRNVERVYSRVFGDRFPDSRSDREDFCTEMLPEDPADVRRYNLGLLDFGAIVCTKESPRFDDCFASEYCVYATSG
ncbi:hypothetical protein JCM30237_12950 [Halolamina litorea]|uniref:HhH-GPD domain-containing protein n=1 Tax=Halolamina litorea TaxID=1515593 RepID=A0ABD6BPH7_9EURY|nr:hypothetical protein [Halolamina litorea]